MQTTPLVIDMNKVFSALSRENHPIAKVMGNAEFKFFVPNYLVEEILRKKDRLKAASKLSSDDLENTLGRLLNCIEFVPTEKIPVQIALKTVELLRDIDMKDVAYVALAFHLNCQLWTGDQKLKSGLRAKGVDIFCEFSPL